MKRIRVVFLSLLVLVTFNLFSPKLSSGETNTVTGSAIAVEQKQAISGNHYTIIHKKDCRIQFVTERPSKNDKKIMLCIPAAFTDLTDYGVDGACISNGTRCNNKVNHSLGGAFKIENGSYSMFSTNKGQMLTDSFLTAIAARKGSLFQQIYIVVNGKAEKFKDINKFQRRAIVEMKDKSWAVIESLESITLADFSKDIVELGALNALYTDMGAWDEGWYRDPSMPKVKVIGQLRSETSRQTNWVIFRAE